MPGRPPPVLADFLPERPGFCTILGGFHSVLPGRLPSATGARYQRKPGFPAVFDPHPPIRDGEFFSNRSKPIISDHPGAFGTRRDFSWPNIS
jgi:hypothetical protein